MTTHTRATFDFPADHPAWGMMAPDAATAATTAPQEATTMDTTPTDLPAPDATALVHELEHEPEAQALNLTQPGWVNPHDPMGGIIGPDMQWRGV